MSIDSPKIQQQIEQSDKNAAFSFSEHLSKSNTQKIANIFADAFKLKPPYTL